LSAERGREKPGVTPCEARGGPPARLFA